MSEELTTKMHSEFSVSEETDIKHRCFSALQDLEDNYTYEQVTKIYNVTEEQIKANKDEFNRLAK